MVPKLRFKLIDKSDEPNSLVQLIGFGLIAAGVIYLLLEIIVPVTVWPNAFGNGLISIIFFIISLGIAFAFPVLLQDQAGALSTMRIAVFMIVNVVCMLLLKIGWQAGNLADIGINGYWVGIIAFVFGSKAAQSFFEDRITATTLATTPSLHPNVTLTPKELTKMAIAQRGAELKSAHPNIVSLSDTLNKLNANLQHVVAIYVYDDNVADIPSSLAVDAYGTKFTVATEIIKNVGQSQLHISQGGDVISSGNSIDYKGSICCLVTSSQNSAFTGALTSAHIYTDGNKADYDGLLTGNQQGQAIISGKNSGSWYLQVMDDSQDLAVAQLNSVPAPDANYRSFSCGYYLVTDADVQTSIQNVTVISQSNPTGADGFIIDYGVDFPVPYSNSTPGNTPSIENIILIGKKNDRDHSTTLTTGGDSGGCVFHKATGRLVGMVLGGTDKFTFVLPVQDTLNKYNLNLI